jgi:hypothetical protein
MMMLVGVIAKQEEPFWSADVEAIGLHTCGDSREDAAAMIKDAIDGFIAIDGFEVTVIEAGPTGGDQFAVLVVPNNPAVFAACLLKCLRERQDLSIADVANASGSREDDIAAYEDGTREPTVGEYARLLSIVAPEMALALGPRTTQPAFHHAPVNHERRVGS